MPDTATSPSPRGPVANLFREIYRILRVEPPKWFPVWLIVVLSLTGLLAFAITGFFGYTYLPAVFRPLVLHDPVFLFLWLCGLIVILQISMVRHPSPPRQQSAGASSLGNHTDQLFVKPWELPLALSVTLLSIAIVAIEYFKLQPFHDLLHQLLQRLVQILRAQDIPQFIAIAANFWFLAFFVADMLRSFVARILANRTRGGTMRVLMASPVQSDRSAWVTLSGNLLAGCFLAAMLAVAFNKPVLNLILYLLLGPNHAVYALSDCQLSVHLGAACSLPHTILEASQLPTLTIVDVFVSACFLVLALIVLPIESAIASLIDGKSTLDVLREAYGETNKLSDVLGRAVELVITPLRNAIWPAFVLLGTFGVAEVAVYIQSYIQLLSCQHQVWFYGRTPASGGECLRGWFWIDSTWATYQWLLLAIVVGALSAVAIVLAGVLHLYDRHDPRRFLLPVSRYWLAALAIVGGKLVVPFGLFSLALCVSNFLVFLVAWLTTSPPRPTPIPPMPFLPPGVMTWVAFLTLIVLLLSRRRRHPAAALVAAGDARPTADEPAGQRHRAE